MERCDFPFLNLLVNNFAAITGSHVYNVTYNNGKVFFKHFVVSTDFLRGKVDSQV